MVSFDLLALTKWCGVTLVRADKSREISIRYASPTLGNLIPNKACAVVLRSIGAVDEILIFRHPSAGCQFVKGTIEPDESPASAAIRELLEEAGIRGARAARHLGVWDAGYKGQVWSIHQLAVDAKLPDLWSHFTDDDGGHLFNFFWHPLGSAPSQDWRPVYVRALQFVEAQLLAPAARTPPE